MTKLTNLIFKNAKHYLTSPFGFRQTINTKAGDTAKFHSGSDYGTNAKKISQYAVEDGTILKAGTDGYGGKYVWIKYPRLNVKMLHYHLDSIAVKTGQKVTKGTLIGKTGMSGRATGIHLHLGIVNLSNGQYLDPEKYNYTEPPKEEPKPKQEKKNGFMHERGYYCKGDKGPEVYAMCKFFATNYWGYFGNSRETAKYKLLGKNGDGNYFGPYLESWVKDFQRRLGLKQDGCVGPITYGEMKKLGFKY